MNTTATAPPGRVITVQAAVDSFLSSPRGTNPSTRRGYTNVLDHLLAELGPDRPMSTVSGDELADLIDRRWGPWAPATFNRNRAAVAAWLTWCTRNRLPAPTLPDHCERRREPADTTRAVSRAAIERALSRRDIPLREKTLWRLLYESAARAREIGGTELVWLVTQ